MARNKQGKNTIGGIGLNQVQICNEPTKTVLPLYELYLSLHGTELLQIISRYLIITAPSCAMLWPFNAATHESEWAFYSCNNIYWRVRGAQFTLRSPPVMSRHVTSCRQTASSGQFTTAVVLSQSHGAVNIQQPATLPVCCGNIFLLNLVHLSLQRRFPSDNSYSRLTMTRRWSSECPGGSGWVCYS